MAASTTGKRIIKMDSNFFTGYRKTIVNSNEIITSVFIPKTVSNQYVLAYKQSKRRDDDISIVNMAINAIFESSKISRLSLAFGGVGSTILLPVGVVDFVNGQDWNESLFEKISNHLNSSINLTSDSPGGESEYRKSLVLSLFFKSFIKISELLKLSINKPDLTSNQLRQVSLVKSSQVFEKTPDNQPVDDPIGRPIVTVSAFKQATGEAVYADDIPPYENELHLGLVLSTKAHAKIILIDASAALRLPGVVGFFSSHDLEKEKNIFGVIEVDEKIFASNTVTTYGQVIGVIAAESRKIARGAVRFVEVQYEELPVVLTIEDAIAAKSFHSTHLKLVNGDFEGALSKCDRSMKGKFRTGKQEHFYLEPQACVIVAKDSDELEVFSATQNAMTVQLWVAKMLDLPISKVTVRVKRLGGKIFIQFNSIKVNSIQIF